MHMFVLAESQSVLPRASVQSSTSDFQSRLLLRAAFHNTPHLQSPTVGYSVDSTGDFLAEEDIGRTSVPVSLHPRVPSIAKVAETRERGLRLCFRT